ADLELSLDDAPGVLFDPHQAARQDVLIAIALDERWHLELLKLYGSHVGAELLVEASHIEPETVAIGILEERHHQQRAVQRADVEQVMARARVLQLPGAAHCA